ncbi:MAG: cyclic pyranopterin monophosphate synthase MoaC [Pseudomonadota bacterium]
MTFSHLDDTGNIRMVDVSKKPDQVRTAQASGEIALAPDTIRKIQDNAIAKGNVLAAAQIAGIQAAKRTGEMIPLCHNIPLSHISVAFNVGPDRIGAESAITCIGKTGAEMEALTAVSCALLTIYDMCKAVDKGMVLGEIRLVSKEKL